MINKDKAGLPVGHVLTDEQISKAWQETYMRTGFTDPIPFARAIEAAVLASADNPSHEEILSLHRQLASEKLRADQGWQRAEAKSKECIELREQMAADNPSTVGADEPVAWALQLKNGSLEFNSGYGMFQTMDIAERAHRQHLGSIAVVPLYLAAPVAQSTAGAAKGGITSDYHQYVKKLEAHAMSLLDAATVYAFAYMQDEAEDEDDCVCGEEQHERAKAVFADIKSLDKVLAATPQAQGAGMQVASDLLNAEELAALRRFDECSQDGEGYDVPKEMMQRLAAIGVVQRRSGAYYQATDFGQRVLGNAPAPATPQDQGVGTPRVDALMATQPAPSMSEQDRIICDAEAIIDSTMIFRRSAEGKALCLLLKKLRATLDHSASPAQASAAPADGWKLVPAKPTDDMIVAFAEQWYSKVRCIDDCEMEDCYAAMLAASPKPATAAVPTDECLLCAKNGGHCWRHKNSAQPVEQPADDKIRDALNTTLWLYRRLPTCYGNPPFVDAAIMAFADVLGIEAPDAIKERLKLHRAMQASKGATDGAVE